MCSQIYSYRVPFFLIVSMIFIQFPFVEDDQIATLPWSSVSKNGSHAAIHLSEKVLVLVYLGEKSGRCNWIRFKSSSMLRMFTLKADFCIFLRASCLPCIYIYVSPLLYLLIYTRIYICSCILIRVLHQKHHEWSWTNVYRIHIATIYMRLHPPMSTGTCVSQYAYEWIHMISYDYYIYIYGHRPHMNLPQRFVKGYWYRTSA